MRPGLAGGASHTLRFTVPESKTVPMLYPESPEFAPMPRIFATGYMVGLMEWACMELIRPYLEDGEGSLGIGINVSHVAATPPGLTVSVEARLGTISGRKLRFAVSAHDGLDLIGEGEHERAIVRWDMFGARLADKERRAGAPA